MLPGLENHSEYVEVTTCACSVYVGVVHVVARQDTILLYVGALRGLGYRTTF